MELLDRLCGYLGEFAEDGFCVAFSGGVDSAVVLKAALGTGARVHSVTLLTPFVTAAETGAAEKLAKDIGAAHTVIRMASLPEAVLANPPDRCYHCKRAIFRAIQEYAAEHRLGHILDGTHAGDLTVYRPGIKALKELGIRSPLAELGLRKDDVRRIAAELGLAVAEKPAAPCLATRIPYGTAIDLDLLPRIDAVEAAVKSLGIGVVRARVHGDTVRLEVPPWAFASVVELREFLMDTVKNAGFERLALDLAGYQSGPFDGKLGL